MSSNLLSFQYYPIMRNVFEHLDAKSLLECFNVSQEFREMAIIHFKKFNEKDWLKMFNLEETYYKDGNFSGIRIEPNDMFCRDQIKNMISKDFIEIFKEQLVPFDSFIQVLDYETLTEDFIRKHMEYLDMFKVSNYSKLTEEFMREFRDDLSWEFISEYQKFSYEFAIEHKDYMCWGTLNNNLKIYEEDRAFLRIQFKDEIERSRRDLEIIEYYNGEDGWCLLEEAYERLTALNIIRF